MNIDLARKWISRWEGRRPSAYDDATGRPICPGVAIVGNPTIGVGLNLLTGSARAAIGTLGLDYSRALAGAVTLDDAQVDYLLTVSINSALAGARSLVAIFDRLPNNQQLVLLDLSFNMGEARMSEFVHMLSYVRLQNWKSAAAELRDSRWFHQVGEAPFQRGGADAGVLENALNPERVLAEAA